MPEHSQGLTRHYPLALGAAVLLAGLVYVNAVDNPFVYDDRRLIVENRSLRPPLNLHAVVLQEATRPVVNLSYAIDRAVWGPEPFGFHVTSILLHMINVALLMTLAWQCARDRIRGAGDPLRALSPMRVMLVTGVLFAVHPMMTEAVGYIGGRSELMPSSRPP